MTKEISFTIWGNPVSAARPRVTRWGTYTPKKYSDYKEHVTETYEALNLGMLFGDGVPIEVNLIFYRQNQKNISKAEFSRRRSLESVPVIMPDIDNYTKAIYDGLNKHAWHDDRQIIRQSSMKVYAEDESDETQPRVDVLIHQLSKEELRKIKVEIEKSRIEGK